MFKKVLNYISYFLISIVFVLFVYVIIQTISDKEISFFGYKFYAIKSDSMIPTFEIDTVIISHEENYDNLNINTIITFDFDLKTNVPNTHRIIGYYYRYLVEDDYKYSSSYDYNSIEELVKNNPNFEVVGYRTKGDNLECGIDVNPVLFESIRGVYVKKSTLLTVLYNVLNNAYGFVVLIIIPLLVLLVLQILNILSIVKEKKVKG